MFRTFVATFICSLAFSANLFAADVEVHVSSRETYVGLPITLQVQISNASTHQPPELPEVDGLQIESAGAPSTSSSISIIQGRRSERTSTVYNYLVTPRREGTFTIPPIKVAADGLSTITKAVRIVASKSETGDLMFVEVAGKQKQIYVGQALELTLRIWIRPYRDPDHQVTLSESNMWQLLSDQTQWGAFRESLEKMAEHRTRPRGRSVLRKDSSGTEREYLLYEIDATVYPTKPGQIDAGDTRIVVNYPTSLGRRRSPFGSLFEDDGFPFGGSLFDDSLFQGFGTGLVVTSVRPISGEATVEPIRVKPIPEQGRPAGYLGAVGQYSIIAEATPTEVKVGDPITLHIGIDGTGPMDLVRAPALAEQSDLTADFKVPDEPLAGFVDGKRKVFTTTIRPNHAGITQIPPISLSYFDPDKEQFVTTTSKPIPITVEKADVLALDAIVGGRSGVSRAAEPESPTNASSDELASSLTLLTGDGLTENRLRPPLVSTDLLAMIAIPPAIVLLILLFAWRGLLRRFVSARRQLRRSLISANSPEQIAAALEQFLVARLGVGQGRSTRDQTVGRLRGSGRVDLAIRAERLYAIAKRSPDHADLQALKAEASSIADELKRTPTSSLRPQNLRKVSASLLVLASLAPFDRNALGQEPEPAVVLSAQQQRELLDEALALYRSALKDPGNEKKFADAADRFQIVVDSGVRNDQLFYNLATARFQAGQLGSAVANYRRALRWNPTVSHYRDGLALAERKLGLATAARQPLVLLLRRYSDLLLRIASPQVIAGACLLAWAAFWAIVALRIARFMTRWKSAAAAMLLIAVVSGGAYLLSVSQYIRDDTAVLVPPQVALREGDGEEFPVVVDLQGAEGRLVEVLTRRGDWIRVELAGGTTGWIRSETAEMI